MSLTQNQIADINLFEKFFAELNLVLLLILGHRLLQGCVLSLFQ